MFIRNFQGMYERLSTSETLKTIRQKHGESLWGYVKHFCNARNTIPCILDVEIINAFQDGVNDINTMEIAMKKPKMEAELLAVTDVCIEGSEARAWLLVSRGKGLSRKKDDREVDTSDWGDWKDWGDHGYRGKQSLEQKEKRPFQCPDDAEEWCEIHRKAGHDLEECKTFLDRKKMLPPATPAPQDPRRGEHRREDPNGDEHMAEINVIFRGSMSITYKTQGKKLQCEITLAQRIELGKDEVVWCWHVIRARRRPRYGAV
jgi:hypothetical protein